MIGGHKPAYSVWPHSVSPLRRLAGGRAPSDPRHNPAPAAFAVGVRRSPRSARRRMFSRRRPITAGRCPSASRLSPRSDRRATWSALPPLRRRSPRPLARTPSVPPAGVKSPPHPGRKGEGTNPVQTARSEGRAPPAPETGRTGGRRARSRSGRPVRRSSPARTLLMRLLPVRPGACGGQTMPGGLLVARGNVVLGVRGHPSARGYRETLTHLAPPKPRIRGAKCGTASAAVPEAVTAPSVRKRFARVAPVPER